MTHYVRKSICDSILGNTHARGCIKSLTYKEKSGTVTKWKRVKLMKITLFKKI